MRGGCCCRPGCGRGPGEAVRVTGLRSGKLAQLDTSPGRRSQALTAGRPASRRPLAFRPFPGEYAHPPLPADPGLAGRAASPTPRKAGLWGLLYLLLHRCGFGVLMWAGEGGRERVILGGSASWGPVGAHGRCSAGSSREWWDLWPGARWEGGGSGGLSLWNDLVSVGACPCPTVTLCPKPRAPSPLLAPGPWPWLEGQCLRETGSPKPRVAATDVRGDLAAGRAIRGPGLACRCEARLLP